MPGIRDRSKEDISRDRVPGQAYCVLEIKDSSFKGTAELFQGQNARTSLTLILLELIKKLQCCKNIAKQFPGTKDKHNIKVMKDSYI